MITRRNFLKTAAAASLPLFISGRAFGANETVNIGLIGLGGRCRYLIKPCLDTANLRIAAVCDCFEPRIGEAMKLQPDDQKWNAYTDFRRMIESENLDAVMVQTTTHARAWVTCHAMAMGMDVYIEKPMSLTIAEGREMVNCARKYGRVTQVGTQQRSIPLNNWASDLAKNGDLGKLTHVLAPNYMGPAKWNPQDAEPMPEGGPQGWWDVWTNQAELRPYSNAIHRQWALWEDYDGGGQSFGVTGWGTHSYDQIQRGLGTDETGPVEIVLEEPVEVKPAGTNFEREYGEHETGAHYYQMIKNVSGPRANVKMKYANGVELLLNMDGDSSPGLGCVFVGEKGRVEVNRDKIWVEPAELAEREDRPEPLQIEETRPLIEDWVNCVKTRGTCDADIEFGQRSTSLCYLVNIARAVGHVGETLKWDPAAERFTNCDEGNAMLARPRRNGYELPA